MSAEVKMKKLFNRGQRQIDCAFGSLLPNQNIIVSEAEAEKLMELFPLEVVELSDIKVIDKNKDTQAALDSARASLENANDKISAQAQEIDSLKEALKEAEAKLAVLASVDEDKEDGLDLSAMTVDQLKELAESNGIELTGLRKKEDLIDAIAKALTENQE